jgi:hypothetical protein
MSRVLTQGERNMVRAMFGGAIRLDEVTIRHSKWAFFQPRNILMAPCGHLHVHPSSDYWSDDYSRHHPELQGLFLHEMTHVWQAQRRGRYYLPLMRHPLCRYDYAVRLDWPLERYGLEQQGEIVRHVHLLRNNQPVRGAPPLATLESILPFGSNCR